jgi:hypothetical protein
MFMRQKKSRSTSLPIRMPKIQKQARRIGSPREELDYNKPKPKVKM